MKKTRGFGLLGIIIIMIITAIISSIATGVIMLNSQSDIIYNENKTIINDEDLNNFIEVYETIVNKYYDEIDKKGMLDAAEEGMLNFLGDKYTTFLEDSEYNDIINELAGTYSGIGIAVNKDNNIIVGITQDSPAEKAGLEENDILVKINEYDVSSANGDRISEIIKDCSGVIALTVLRNGVELNFNVEKADLINISVEYKVIEDTEIGYIDIEKFSENLSDQVKNALTYLENQNIKSLIIDVRGNVGGYLSAAEDTASLFLDAGKVIYYLETSSNTLTYKDETREKRNYDIAVLVDGNSASAAEILAAALKESYGAKLVGTKTYGKGKVQQIVSDSAKYTFAKWLTPNKKCIDGIGITPDYIVTNGNSNLDNQLNKAIELLS